MQRLQLHHTETILSILLKLKQIVKDRSFKCVLDVDAKVCFMENINIHQ